MNSKYLRILELDKILARLAAHTAFSASEELARALEPSADPAEVTRALAETSEARALLDQHSEMTIGGARDVRHQTRNARIDALLNPLDLLEIRQTLLAARTLRRALARLSALYPRLSTRASLLEEVPAVVDAVARSIDDRGEVMDTASDELARIRRELNVVRGRLMERLQRILGSSGKILQEPIITQRQGRYVIPVRAEAKGRITGIVHDASASGATLFIEPLAVVEMGNRVRELESQEAREVERILRELTGLVAAHADAIDLTVETLAQLDLAFAKAKYSAEIRGVEPEFSLRPRGTEGQVSSSKFQVQAQARSSSLKPESWNLKLINARHPLLDPTKVVPVSISLGDEFSILIITGPNTGGKTVTLKTVGLLALMAQSGLHIPADPGSHLPIYTGIFADIGDEQSIEQSLSTFSSHLKNIVEILREADSRSLVLLDELGAGTDPVEGSALARAILTHLLERRVPALVATHYAELKAFAHSTPGVQNASMEFDLETLSPTYQLTIGLPGRSNAFAIAGRLGLAADIIGAARGALDQGDVEMEDMLAEIRAARQQAASARAHAEMEHRQAEKLELEARRKLAEAEKARSEMLERARADARAEIELAREELERLRQEWRTVSLTRDFVEQQEAKLEQLGEQLPVAPPARTTPPALQPQPGEIQVGDSVWVPQLGQVGQVVSLDTTGADVQVGSFRVRLKRDELGERVAPQPTPAEPASRITLPAAESPGVEISLRGLRADDALDRLEKYLDRAYLAGLPYVRIVHGKGTGTLRKLARDLLREHPLVAEVREAPAHEGGEGVTIAKLVSR